MNQEGIRCGFFNSVNNDRKYDAEDMGRLFEGVISDGVFSSVEPKFEVEPVPETMDLVVNNGKAWFYERYFEIYNPITVSIRATDINPRIDAICICINTNESVRAGSIEVVEGPYGEEPSRPSMPEEDGVYYIPIAWITIGPNDTVSTDLDIVSNVGNSTDPVESYRCPYSEPSLDPRRAIYAYEGEGGEDPVLNEDKVKIVESTNKTYYQETDTTPAHIRFTADFPEGYNFDNTIILGVMFRHNKDHIPGGGYGDSCWWEFSQNQIVQSGKNQWPMASYEMIDGHYYPQFPAGMRAVTYDTRHCDICRFVIRKVDIENE